MIWYFNLLICIYINIGEITGQMKKEYKKSPSFVII